MSKKKILKQISVNGVQFVEVDEDSPLLPKDDRPQRAKTDALSRARRNFMIFACVVCGVLVSSILLVGRISSSLHNMRHGVTPPAVVVEEGNPPQDEVSSPDKEQACHEDECFKRARVRASEIRPNFPSFWNYAEQGPYNVSYDARSLLLNGERALFLSGSLHPVRATPETWAWALDNAVRQGLNMISTYVFWAAHQPFPDVALDWSLPGGDWDLADAIRAAANRGLFVHIRIGPYACAEYNYGGIPEWVALGNPDMAMRRFDPDWMDAMEDFVEQVVTYLTDNKLWAYQGGPIVMGQIENELGEDDDTADGDRVLGAEGRYHPTESKWDEQRKPTLQDYANWCGDLAARVAPNVLWTMCNGLTAPNAINTCNGFGGTGCSTSWLESNGQSGRIQLDQPALWTEDEQGFQVWGEESSNPSDYFWGSTAREMTREGLQWFARGGSYLNYYMWWGGYNRGRAAASGIMNMYASDACLCPSGQLRQPKYGHFLDFHEAIASIAPVFLNTESALGKAQVVEHWTDDGQWKVGDKQRMFVYGNASGTSVVFVENDANESVTVNIPSSSGRDEAQSFRMQPLSAAVLVDDVMIFESGSVNPRHKSYRRRIDPDAAVLLDWTTWAEPIGAQPRDRRTIVSSRPIEQTSLMMEAEIDSDFAWYETDLNLIEHIDDATIHMETQKASAMSVFVDEEFVGAADNHEHSEGSMTLEVNLGTVLAGRSRISILSESLGYFNLIGRWGAGTGPKTKGITGDVVLTGKLQRSSSRHIRKSLVDGRKWKSYPGLHMERSSRYSTLQRRKASTRDSWSFYCSWSSALFDTPNYDPTMQALMVDITSGRGRLWLNGFDLGRFWNITRGETDEYSQRYYFFPNELLYTDGRLNELVLFNALSGDSSATSLALTWLEADEKASLEDEVDYPNACI